MLEQNEKNSEVNNSVSFFQTKTYSNRQIATFDRLRQRLRAERSFAYLERFSDVHPQKQSPLTLQSLRELLDEQAKILTHYHNTPWQDDFEKLLQAIKASEIMLMHCLSIENYSAVKQSANALLSPKERQRLKLDTANQRTSSADGRDDNVFFSLGMHDQFIDEQYLNYPGEHHPVKIQLTLNDHFNEQGQLTGPLQFMWFGPHSIQQHTEATDMAIFGGTKRIIRDVGNIRIYEYVREDGELFSYTKHHRFEIVMGKDIHEFMALKMTLELRYLGEPYRLHVLEQLENTEILGGAINCLFRYPAYDAKVPIKMDLSLKQIKIVEPRISALTEQELKNKAKEYSEQANEMAKAIDKRDLTAIKSLIDKNPNILSYAIDVGGGQMILSPLLYALDQYKKTGGAIIDLLLRGHCVLLRNNANETALHYAVREKDPELVLKILSASVDYQKDPHIKLILNPNIRGGYFGEWLSPLEKAFEWKGNNAIIDILTSHHAYPTGRELQMSMVSRDLDNIKKFLPQADIACKRAALVIAIKLLNKAAINLILDSKINIDGVLDNNPNAFFDEATSIRALYMLILQAKKESLEGQAEYCQIVTLLCQAGINVNATDLEGKNALFYAVELGCSEIAKILEQYGAKHVTPPGHIENLSVVAVIRAKDKHGRYLYLMGRKDDEDFYSFPGGGKERGETAKQAAARETFEETGIKLDPESAKLIFTYEGIKPCAHYINRRSVDEKIHTEFMLFECGNIAQMDTPLACSDMQFVKWVMLEDVDQGLKIRESNLKLLHGLKNYNDNESGLLSERDGCVDSDEIIAVLNTENKIPTQQDMERVKNRFLRLAGH